MLVISFERLFQIWGRLQRLGQGWKSAFFIKDLLKRAFDR